VKVKIAYHESPDKGIEEIAIVEASFIHTRGISIDTITAGPSSTITFYPKTRPGRIDQQKDVVYLIGKEYAKEHPEPYKLYTDTKFFGEPVTVYRLTPL